MLFITKTSSPYFIVWGLLCWSYGQLGNAAHRDNEASISRERFEGKNLSRPSHKKHFVCPVDACPSVYTRKYDLKQHIINKHPEDAQKYPDICEQEKSSKSGKLWPCPEDSCKSGYTRKGDLKTHISKKHPQKAHLYPYIMRGQHSKVGKDFPCIVPLCDCGYARPYDLKEHMKNKHADWLALVLKAAQENEALDIASKRTLALSNLVIPTAVSPKPIRPEEFLLDD